ncbi:Bax inhibitor-1/YccA family membrane protein [Leekyejoonella antrihumi]|uniref:Bax inhibitor-1/YccA family protein n=1 Tax=Leekyejoonella antrihumi TaxID=1660198 RepID=A0A563DTA0_9MICO|nr:Bax inhibitor-1/YccA family protein [Leekyejoonella antrihumi]TWP33465.1 Bax inhibitor-1/YccA family protein [Leekyejoonella antrihumi]
MANNPVFNRFNDDLSKGRYASIGKPQYGQYATPDQQQQQQYGAPQGYPNTGAQQAYQPPQGGRQYGGPQGYPQGRDPLESMYQKPSASAVQSRKMTLDDVVTKTLGLFGIMLVTGAISWFVAKDSQPVGMGLWIGGMIVGLAIGFIISFKRVVSVPLIVGYAAVEGLFLGAVSQFFNTIWPGVVAQAVLATICVFVGMFAGWKFGIIRVTERSRKIFGFAIMGYFLFAMVNFLLVMTGVLSNPFGVGGSGPLGIVISIIAVGLASYSLAIDFDSIGRGINAGLPQKYSWLMAHGLIVSVVWLYIELLRLFARMRN